MAISLYRATVESYLQTLGAVSGYLDRGLSHCADNGIDAGEVVETRLFADMQPFRFQIQSVTHHSLGAIEGVKRGVFTPPPPIPPVDYPGLQKMVADAREALQALTPDEVNGLEGQEVTFDAGALKLPFLAEDFLLTFSLPNFHFHATTAYDILRMKGVPLGKRDYMGRMRIKRG
jgi:hypothetical protein